MTLAAFVFFLAGAIGEIAVLWNSAWGNGSRFVNRSGRFRVFFSRSGFIGLGLAAAALCLSFVLRWLQLAQVRVSLDDAWVGIIFTILGLFLIGAGVIGDGLLPRVDERAVLTVQILVALFTLTQERLPARPGLLGLVGIPLLVSLGLVIWRRALAPPVQALVYFGYLLALLALTYQTANLNSFSAVDFSNGQALAFGGLFVFLLLHGLFTIRFFLIVSSLILPRNRPMINGMMARLYSNEQISLPRFVLFTLILASLVLLNARYRWIAPEIVVSLAVMTSAQVMGFKIGRVRGGA
jgi:hypothetical protein